MAEKLSEIIIKTFEFAIDSAANNWRLQVLRGKKCRKTFMDATILVLVLYILRFTHPRRISNKNNSSMHHFLLLFFSTTVIPVVVHRARCLVWLILRTFSARCRGRPHADGSSLFTVGTSMCYFDTGILPKCALHDLTKKCAFWTLHVENFSSENPWTHWIEKII